MDYKRAREITSSPVMANVTWNGAQVYIEDVNGDNRTANVHTFDKPGKSQRVNLTDLSEH